MKIALFGYGRMGKTIERLALSRGHEIVAIINHSEDAKDLNGADVAIDFSLPDAAFDNIVHCFELGIPVVSGTTGWLERYQEAVALCEEKGAAFIYGSNFSLGVNLFFELNKKLAGLMKGMDMYQASMEEIHHTKKLDAPSGTAITLAEGLIEEGLKSKWSLDEDGKESLKIDVKRQGDVPGTHSIAYRSEVDEIYIRHEAFNRDGFGLGAVVAAEWLKGKTGVYSMKDVLNL